MNISYKLSRFTLSREQYIFKNQFSYEWTYISTSYNQLLSEFSIYFIVFFKRHLFTFNYKNDKKIDKIDIFIRSDKR